MSSAGGVQRRVRWARLALLALLPAAAAAVCCKSSPQRIELPREQIIEGRTKDYWREVLEKDNASWVSLEAACSVAISNPRMQEAPRAVVLSGGRLVIKKPNMIYLRLPEKGDVSLALVGDGQKYRVDMPVAQVDYSGTYDDAGAPRRGAIRIMPADIVDAFCPADMVPDTVMVLTEQERISKLSLVKFILGPDGEKTQDVRMAGVITVDRMTDVVGMIERFDAHDSIFSRITYRHRTAASTGGARSVPVPDQVLIDYPADQTRIMLTLTDIRLNQLSEKENLFVVSE